MKKSNKIIMKVGESIFKLRKARRKNKQNNG